MTHSHLPDIYLFLAENMTMEQHPSTPEETNQYRYEWLFNKTMKTQQLACSYYYTQNKSYLN